MLVFVGCKLVTVGDELPLVVVVVVVEDEEEGVGVGVVSLRILAAVRIM